jgi:hypothetical protein
MTGTLNATQVRAIMLFAFNYKSDFIQVVYGNDVWLTKHLEEKFQDLYDKYGATGVMMKFISELDMENLEKLTKYINSLNLK